VRVTSTPASILIGSKTALATAFSTLSKRMNQKIVGQSRLVERLLMSLLADGHLLVEGAPGLAKTKAIQTLGDEIEGDFQRIQFTPDLLPSDITGTEIYRPETGTFVFQRGPVFHNLVLADEINRAPAKVQSALLEAMAERQVSVGRETMPLPPLFLVMATQNPIEQEGTYPLPEAQLDRFLMHVKVEYPEPAFEKQILALARGEALGTTTLDAHAPVSQDTILAAREQVVRMHMADAVEEYLLQLIQGTRTPAAYGDDLASWIEYGASPRATIALDRCARAHAWLRERDYVSPDDVQAVIHDCLRHRLILNFEAEAEGRDADQVVDALLDRVPVS
jgi:MoxR-like ATPase